MAIIRDFNQVKKEYETAAKRGWVIPCFCSENLTTTEAILSAAKEHGEKIGIKDLPVIIALTVKYDHRSQARYYTHTRNWETGLKLFTSDVSILAEQDEQFKDIHVMLHLDHVQHDADEELLSWDLSEYSSIMYDASTLPFEENIAKTRAYVEKMKGKILIEGACDEIFDATGLAHNAITTPENAKRYFEQTGVDLIVANLGTEHRASGKDLKYYSEASLAVKNEIGANIVLHGTSSVPNSQVAHLYADGICKVNIWTALERDSSPVLLEEMVKNAVAVGGSEIVEKLQKEGYLTSKFDLSKNADLAHFTTVYRQDIVFNEMKKMVRNYLEMWYKI
ncbi:MAG: class II fructose-bisphosphate aldolase [Saccharofermentanales bacterium]